MNRVDSRVLSERSTDLLDPVFPSIEQEYLDDPSLGRVPVQVIEKTLVTPDGGVDEDELVWSLLVSEAGDDR